MASLIRFLTPAEVEDAHGYAPKLGDIVHFEVSRTEEPLPAVLRRADEAGRDLYLVAAGSGKAIWLVGVLRSPSPSRGGREWRSTVNVVPVLDVTALVSELRLEHGKGVLDAKNRDVATALSSPAVLHPSDRDALEKRIAAGPGSAVGGPPSPSPRSMLAIVSKDVFERARTKDGEKLDVGDVYGPSEYVSTNQALRSQLDSDLYLVTVRGDRLWWVGTLRSPRHDGRSFRAEPDTNPIVDITEGAKKLVFANGKGIQLSKMAMSLQTPRVLTADDVALFSTWRGASASRSAKRTTKTAAKARPSPPKAAAPGGALTIEGRDLEPLRRALAEAPESLDLAMTDKVRQLPLIVRAFAERPARSVKRLRLTTKGFDPRDGEVGAPIITKPLSLDALFPALERLVLEGYGFFAKLGHRRVKDLELSGMPIDAPWAAKMFPAVASLRWVYPTDVHGVASEVDVLLPLFVDEPFPSLVRLDLAEVDLDSEEPLNELAEITDTSTWRRLESVLMPGAAEPLTPRSVSTTVAPRPPPKLPLRLELGHASLVLDRGDPRRPLAHVLSGAERDAGMTQLARHLQDAKPGDIERVHLELEGDRPLKSASVVQLVRALGALPRLRQLSMKGIEVRPAVMTALGPLAAKLERLDLIDPSFDRDAAFATLEPFVARLEHLGIEQPGVALGSGAAKRFIAAASKSQTLRSLHVRGSHGALEGAAAGAAWSKVAGDVLEDFEHGAVLHPAGVEQLASGLRGAPALRHLGLHDTRAGAGGLRKLASSRLAVRALTIFENELDDDDGCAAFGMLLGKMRSLRELTVLGSCLDDGGKAVAAGLRESEAIERLTLRSTQFSGAHAVTFAKAVGAHRTLSALGVSLETSDKAQRAAIISALSRRITTLLHTSCAWPSWLVIGLLEQGVLTSLDLTGSSLDIEQNMPAIYTAASRSKTLVQLATTSQQHSAAARRALVELIQKSTVLRHLDVRWTNVSDDEGALARVLRAAARSSQLETLTIWDRHASTASKALLYEAMAAGGPRLRVR